MGVLERHSPHLLSLAYLLDNRINVFRIPTNHPTINSVCNLKVREPFFSAE